MINEHDKLSLRQFFQLKMKKKFFCFVFLSGVMTACGDGQKNPFLEGYKSDIGPILHELGRPAVWKSQEKKIEGTHFRIKVGASVYQDENNNDPDYYKIEVGYNLNENRVLVCYSRDFSMKDLPIGFLKRDISKIIEYENKTDTIVFKIGEKKLRYVLPKTR